MRTSAEWGSIVSALPINWIARSGWPPVVGDDAQQMERVRVVGSLPQCPLIEAPSNGSSREWISTMIGGVSIVREDTILGSAWRASRSKPLSAQRLVRDEE